MLLLVIDDDPSVRAAVADALAAEGIDVVGAAGVSEAMAQIARGLRPDVILLDLLLPDVDGWRFLSARLGVPELVATPVVLMSAAPLRTRAKGTGAVAFLEKPFTIDQLANVVQQAADVGRQVAPALSRSLT